MRITRWLLPFALLCLAACGTPSAFHHEYAAGHYSSDIQQCVPYARKVSGVRLYGDADSWWQQAPPHYARGSTPLVGAVLVLKKTARMHSGHVAVVTRIVGPRHVDVTHSNWGDTRALRHIVYDSMRAEDVSQGNDWSQVRFWNDAKNVFGFPYAAYGFIYP